MKNKYNSIFCILAAFLSIHVVSSEVLANTEQSLSDDNGGSGISHERFDQDYRTASYLKEATIEQVFALLGKIWSFIHLDPVSMTPIDLIADAFSSGEISLFEAFNEVARKHESISKLREHIKTIEENDLLSEESIQFGASLVKEIEDLVQLYSCHIEHISPSLFLKVKFEYETALAEWKALLAKKFYDAQHWEESIESAQSAVAARRKASVLASQLGWAVEGSAQLEYAEWPGGILAEARVQVRKEKIRGIEQVEALCIEIQRNIESLGEAGAYSNEGFQLRRQYLEWLKVLKEKWKEIEDIQKEKAVYFLSLTVEAEINNIQSKRLYDLGLFDEARLFANRATDKRDDAFYCARVLGWFQDALLQLEYKRWSAILLKKAISAHKNQSM